MSAVRITLCLMVVLLLTGSVFAGGGYHEETLSNGLRVILVEHHANPMICFSTVVGAGVVHEPAHMNGSSHFLEHLLFNGTATRTQRELYDEVDLYGGYNNATTREDHTLYMMLIQTEFAERGLDIQADMLLNSILPDEKFEKEKGIVLEELAQDKGRPGYMVTRAFREFAYAGTRAEKSVLGTEESISSLKRDDVYAYYKSRYVPNNMTVVVMGDFVIPEMLELVRSKFGGAEPGEIGGPFLDGWPAAPENNIRTIANDEPRLYLKAAMPLPWERHDPRTVAADLLVRALAEGDDSPLGRQLSSAENPLTLRYSLGLAPREGRGTTLELDATLEEGSDPMAVLDLVARALQSLGRGSVARQRVESVRREESTAEILLADQIHYYAMMNSSWIHGSPAGYLRDRVRLLDDIGDDVLDQAAEGLAAALAGARIVTAGPGAEPAAAAWEAPPPPVAEKSSADLFETLPNGAEVVFTRNDDSQVFALHLMFRPRSALEPAGKEGIADFLHRMFLRGSVVVDKEGLAERMEQLGATLKAYDSAMIPFDDYYSRPEFSFVRLEMPARRWREGVALLSELIRFPRLTDEDVEAVRREMLDVVRRNSDSANTLGSRAMLELLAPGTASASNIYGSEETVAGITAADLATFHEAYVTGDHLVLSGVGPVDPGELLRTVKRSFRSLRGKDEEDRGDAARPVTAVATEAGLVRNLELGKDQSFISLAYLFEAKPQDQTALAVAGALLSDKVAFAVREEQGLAYRTGCSFGRLEGLSMFEATIATRPDNIERAREAIVKVLDVYAAGQGIEEADVARTVNAVRGRQIMRRMSRVNQAYFLGLDRLSDEAPGAGLQRTRSLLEVTAADVKRVLKQYLDTGRLATVVVK